MIKASPQWTEKEGETSRGEVTFDVYSACDAVLYGMVAVRVALPLGEGANHSG